MRRRAGKRVTGVALCALLVGCQSATEPGPQSHVAQAERVERQQQAIEQFDAFRVRGGIGIWNDTESLSARMSWQESDGARSVGLRGPAGIGSLQLHTEVDGRASLKVGQRPEQTGPTADVLLRQVLGLQSTIPLTQLSQWIRGLPGDATSLVHDAEGRLRSLRWQDDAGTRWSARIKQYRGFEDISLPALVTAQGAGYRVRIVLKDWQRAPVSREEEKDQKAPAGDDDSERPMAPERLPIPGRQSGWVEGIGYKRS